MLLTKAFILILKKRQSSLSATHVNLDYVVGAVANFLNTYSRSLNRHLKTFLYTVTLLSSHLALTNC